jgi:hypothetical protein
MLIPITWYLYVSLVMLLCGRGSYGETEKQCDVENRFDEASPCPLWEAVPQAAWGAR